MPAVWIGAFLARYQTRDGGCQAYDKLGGKDRKALDNARQARPELGRVPGRRGRKTTCSCL